MVGVRTLVLPTAASNRVVLAVRNYEWDVVKWVVHRVEHKRELEVTDLWHSWERWPSRRYHENRRMS